MNWVPIVYAYEVYDQRIHSAIRLDLLSPPDASSVKPAGTISVLNASADELFQLQYVEFIRRMYRGFLRSYHTSDGILICFSNRFYISVQEHTNTIRIHIARQDYLDEAAPFLVKTVLSTYFLLRGYIPIHAAGVCIDGKSVGFAADSGTGKSTLLWRCLGDGGLFITDDVLLLSSGDGVSVIPSMSIPAKMGIESVRHYGIDPLSLVPITPDAREYWVHLSRERHVVEPTPLSALFILSPCSDGECGNAPEIHRVRKLDALVMLRRYTHSLWTLSNSMQSGLFVRWASVADVVPIFIVRFRKSFAALDHIVDAIRAVL